MIGCYGREAALDPLRVILATGKALGGSWSIGLKLGVVEEVASALLVRDMSSRLLEDVGGESNRWSFSCLAKFRHCLGMLVKGFKGEILKLLKKMIGREE